MKKLILFLSVLQSALVFSAIENTQGVQNFRTIGPGASCNYNTSNGASLQDALNSGNYELRLVNDSIYLGPFTASGAFHLRGGYNSCSDAISDIQGTNQSVLDANFIDTTITLSINGSYVLENIKIINGSANLGGGIKLSAADMTVKLDRVILENNQAVDGAGIYKTGESNNVYLTIVDSIIRNNSTSVGGIGGGIYFESLGEVIIYGDTLFTENEAEYGGALYLKDTTAILVVGENPMVASGIRSNRALSHGAGIYTDSSTIEITGGLKNIPGVGVRGLSGQNYVFLSNIADSNNTLNGLGGAMFLYRNSDITLNAISIIDNHTYFAGGGIYSYLGTIIHMGFPENSNCQTSSLNSCNLFINNSAFHGGAFNSSTGAQSHMTSVNFNGNRANQGTVANISGQSTLNLTSSVMYNNGDSGNNGFTDKYSLGSFSSSIMNLEHITAVKNNNTDSFILASNGQNLLNSYNNYLYNPSSGPWLELLGTPQQTIVYHACQIVDETNNSVDNSHNLTTTNAFFNDTQYFINEANHDYHLKNTSNLIDYVGENCTTNLNLFNNKKDMDNQPRTDNADLGADENLFNDIIFVNDFEDLNIPG